MDGKKILIYGKAATGKSRFVKKVNGIETNKTDYSNPKPFPVIYVYNVILGDVSNFDIIINFESRENVLFEKGWLDMDFNKKN